MLKFLIEKEFKLFFRNSFLPKLVILLPVVMLLVMPWAANQEIKNLKLSVVDADHSTYSQRLVQKITSSNYFHLTDVSSTNRQAMQSIEQGKSDIILEIQPDFEKNLLKDGSAEVLISANAVNGTQGSLGSAYLTSIIRDFSSELLNETGMTKGKTVAPVISIVSYNKFNPHLDYKVFMVPAIMVMLLTMLAGFLPALNIVSEKETGTIEQMNVTPVHKFLFILAKLIPYWIIGFVVLSIGMGIAASVYRLFPVGSLLTLYGCASIYILVVSGLGLVISNYSGTMQQAMFVMFFFIMIFILMSGLFTPVSSMPGWAQAIAGLNPLKYFMQIMRAVYLKGSGMADLLPQLFALCIFALGFNAWAVLSYRKSR